MNIHILQDFVYTTAMWTLLTIFFAHPAMDRMMKRAILFSGILALITSTA